MTWWLANDDGTVWPCEMVHPAGWPDHWTVRPLAPAPDAGVERVVPTIRIYESALAHPTKAAA